jgi:hypothetical protein
MPHTYEKIDTLEVIIRTEESGTISAIPKDPANSDYQEYLKSLESPGEEI